MLFSTWLRTARAQAQDNGVDFRAMACEPGRLTPFVNDELSAVLYGLERLYLQIPAVVLPDEQQRERWEQLRDAYIHHLAEALGGIALALTAVGCTEEELEEALQPLVPVDVTDNSSEGCTKAYSFTRDATTTAR